MPQSYIWQRSCFVPLMHLDERDENNTPNQAKEAKPTDADGLDTFATEHPGHGNRNDQR
jgi:hypothetical protein